MSTKQHEGLPVAGYKPQESANVALVNRNKAAEETVLRILDELESKEGVDRRWLAIGRTAIEQGFMAVNRAVFKPGRVKLPDDDRLTIRFAGKAPYSRDRVAGETWREVIEQAAKVLRDDALIDRVDREVWWLKGWSEDEDFSVDDEIPEHRGARVLEVVFRYEDAANGS